MLHLNCRLFIPDYFIIYGLSIVYFFVYYLWENNIVIIESYDVIACCSIEHNALHFYTFCLTNQKNEECDLSFGI